MAKDKPPPKRRRLNPAQRPKLAANVPKPSAAPLSDRPPGRPPLDERVRATFLRCLGKGLNLATAMDIAGISPGQVHRWKQEIDADGVGFGQKMRQAKARLKLVAARSLEWGVGMDVDRKGVVKRAPDLPTVRWYLERTSDFEKKPKADPVDAARQIRAFVAGALTSQLGSKDAAMDTFDEDDLDDDRDESDAKGSASDGGA